MGAGAGDIGELTIGASSTVLHSNGTTASWKNIFFNIISGLLDLASQVTGILPVANGGTGLSSLASGIATWWGTPSSANLASAVTDETGTGLLVFGTNPVLTTPNLGTPSAVTLTNGTGLPLTSGVTGVLPLANGGTASTTVKVWSVTIASTSPAFISGGLLPIPTEFQAYTMARIACKIDTGTSVAMNIEDGTPNATESITCDADGATDDGSITNAEVTALEEMYINFGAVVGAVDYLTITVYK